MRRRLQAACARFFVDLAPLSDQDAAARIEADGVDILVDLKGYTQFGESGESPTFRPAPIQRSSSATPARWALGWSTT